MEVSSDSRIRDLVLLIGRIFSVGDVEGMSENAMGREESSHEAVPVGQIISALRSLREDSQYRVGLPMLRHHLQGSRSSAH